VKVVALLAVFAVVAIGVLSYMIDRMLGDHSNVRTFDRQVWLSAAGNRTGSSPRGEMMGDLQRNYLKAGMSRKQITDLLGAPTDREAGGTYVYRLGNRVGCQLCPDFLRISFDRRGYVSKVQVKEE
jgi:outer membrane protein assembly factor BamE (lipoprotein component of BamABCDE complex)